MAVPLLLGNVSILWLSSFYRRCPILCMARTVPLQIMLIFFQVYVKPTWPSTGWSSGKASWDLSGIKHDGHWHPQDLQWGAWHSPSECQTILPRRDCSSSWSVRKHYNLSNVKEGIKSGHSLARSSYYEWGSSLQK